VKLSRKKLLIVAPVLLLVGLGAAYKLVLAPKPAQAKKKIDGVLYPLASDFTINLAGGRYAKVSVALLLSEAPAASAEASATGLPQEAAVRAIVTDTLTGEQADVLIDRGQRHALEKKLLKALHAGTDEPVTQVLLTDIAIE
jgi:flagellar FliL protein